MLKMLYPSASADTIMAALPSRSWAAIVLRARRLNLVRQLVAGVHQRRSWTDEDDERLKQFYQEGTPCKQVASDIGRSESAVTHRIWELGLNRSPSTEKGKRRIRWDTCNLISSQQSPSGGGQGEDCLGGKGGRAANPAVLLRQHRPRAGYPQTFQSENDDKSHRQHYQVVDI